jgi:hypothetical protein
MNIAEMDIGEFKYLLKAPGMGGSVRAMLRGYPHTPVSQCVDKHWINFSNTPYFLPHPGDSQRAFPICPGGRGCGTFLDRIFIQPEWILTMDAFIITIAPRFGYLTTGFISDSIGYGTDTI